MHIAYKPRITQKVNLLFLFFGLLIFLSIIIPAYLTGRKILEEDSISKLDSISLQKQLTIEGWLTYTQTIIEEITLSPYLQKDLTAVFDSAPGSTKRQQSIDLLSRDLQIWTQSKNLFTSLSVIDQESGLIIASTHSDEIGQDVSDEPFFLNGEKGVVTQNPFYSKPFNEPAIRISLPFRSTGGGGKAALAVQINLNKITDIIQRGTSEFDSIDIYLINNGYQIVVKPRHLPNASILQDTLHSEAIDHCVAGNSGAMKTQNYQGLAVISSYTWLADRQLCLVVEEHQAAAFIDINRFTNNMILSGLIALALALFLALSLSRTITKPILTLLHHVNKLGAEQWDDRIAIKTTDEFGVLSQAFNQMAAKLTQSIKESKNVAEENMRLYQVAQERGNQLQEERNFTNKLLDTTTSLIFVIDIRGRVIVHNQSLETLTGYSYEDIHNNSYIELANAPLGSFQNVAPLEYFLANRYPLQFEGEFLTSSGELRQIAYSSGALYDSSDQIEYIINVGIDITERKQIEEKLRNSERNFQVALAAAPISVYTTDQDLRITFMHDPHPQFNQEDVLGKRMDEFLPPETADPLLSIQRLVLETRTAQRGQLFTQVDGQAIWYVYYADPIFNSTGVVVGLACAGYDVTDLKVTEQALLDIKQNLEQIVEQRTSELRQSQKTLQTMLDAIPEFAALVDKDGTILAGNQTLAERFNVRIDLLIGRNLYDFFPPDVAASRKIRVDHAFVKGQTIRYMDIREGRYFDNTLYPVIQDTGVVSALAIISIEVTKWKLAEETIEVGRERLQELTRKVVVAQEEERHRISRELHDEAGQALTALSISLKLFHSDMPDILVEEKKRLADAITLVGATMEQIRVLAQDLRPQALDALGLNDTLEGFCRTFSIRTKIEIIYQGVNVPRLPDITAVSLYRFLQESLVNAAKHSEAKHICVTLTLTGDMLTLTVQDDGVGFVLNTTDQKSGSPASHGIGLLGMRERIEMLGGSLWIETQPMHGTRLVATIDTTLKHIDWKGRNDTSRNRG